MSETLNKLKKILGLKSDPYKGTALEGIDVQKSIDKDTGNFTYSLSKNKEPIGQATFNTSEMNEKKFITGSPEIDPKYQKKGLATEMYRMAERDSGKTIIPDGILTEHGVNLHNKKGLGKNFGSSDYSADILEGLEERAKFLNSQYGEKLNPKKFAKEAYEDFVKRMKRQGVSKFKSIAPYLAKGAALGATGGLSLGAEAASEAFDTETEGSAPEEAQMKRESDEAKLRKLIQQKGGDEAIQQFEAIPPVMAQDLLTEEKGPKLKKLSKLLGR